VKEIINLQFPKFELNGKFALITGGAGLLGKEHARAILQAGADIVLWDINSVALTEAEINLCHEFPNRKIVTKVVDITREEAVKEAQSELANAEILISILINNAAINPKYEGKAHENPSSRVENFEMHDWNHQLGVGLTGAFICSKIFGTLMAEIGSGVILNIASDLSVISPDQRLYAISGRDKKSQPVKPVTYSVIKSGLIGLTRYLATYWHDSGVRVNALSPGGVYEGQADEFVSKLSARIPLGRMANADEYRSAIQFLCSDASSYMTGQNLVIDGGRSVW